MFNRRLDKYFMFMIVTEEEAVVLNYEVLLRTYIDREGY